MRIIDLLQVINEYQAVSFYDSNFDNMVLEKVSPRNEKLISQYIGFQLMSTNFSIKADNDIIIINF